MYPVLRMVKDLCLASRQPPLNLLKEHRSFHICWPWDLDIWLELNNGRTMTLFDLGRTMLSWRVGLIRVLRQKRWSVTVAGSSVRFRKRIRLFERIEMRSVCVGWDDKFIYLEQSMWKANGDCANHALLRTAVTDAHGIVAPPKLLAALGATGPAPELPDWVKAWCAADHLRPWPPQRQDAQDGVASP